MPNTDPILWNVSTRRRLAVNINIREFSVKLTTAVPAGWISACGLPNNISYLVIHHILNANLLQEGGGGRTDVWHLVYDPHEESATSLLAPNSASTGSLLNSRLKRQGLKNLLTWGLRLMLCVYFVCTKSCKKCCNSENKVALSLSPVTDACYRSWEEVSHGTAVNTAQQARHLW
jgi:hypothetical protein